MISKGETYYFNNGKVTILKVETDNFVLVCGDKDIHTEVNGSEFCHGCMVGGISGVHTRHTCDEADDVIEQVLEDISDQDIFWVNVKHLQTKPFEYKKWEKIIAENNTLSLKTEELKKENQELEDSILSAKTDYTLITEDLASLKERKDILITEIEEKEIEKIKIIAEKDSVITLKDSNVKLSVSQILEYIKRDLTLGYLETGGVDNWEWYGESLPDCEDVDTFIENEALNVLFKIKS